MGREAIRVLEEYLNDYDTSVENIGTELSNISTTIGEIDAILGSDSWKGDAHDKCLEAFGKISQYQTDTNTCFDELKTAIKDLIDHTDNFVSTSSAVATLF